MFRRKIKKQARGKERAEKGRADARRERKSTGTESEKNTRERESTDHKYQDRH
jgi:hypothetical protein